MSSLIEQMPHEGWVWLVVLLVAAVVVQTFRLAWLRARPGVRSRERNRIAGEAEVEALDLVRAAGYQVQAVQPRASWIIEVDGMPRTVDLRADLLLSKRGERFVADVKSGGMATRVETAATRRQLLEYWLAYEVDGVLLVDMQARRLRRIEFGVQARRNVA